MNEIDELKKKLSDIQNRRKEDQEIKKLKKHIKAEKFGQTKTGKVFNKIADFGEGLGKIIMDADRKADARKKGKVKSMQETMARLPQ